DHATRAGYQPRAGPRRGYLENLRGVPARLRQVFRSLCGSGSDHPSRHCPGAASLRPPDSSCQSHASTVLRLFFRVVWSTIPAPRCDLRCEYRILNYCREQRNQADRLAHFQCANRASRLHRPSGQRDSFGTLPTTIPDTNGRLLLLQSCENLTASSRPDADGINYTIPAWNESLPHLRHAEFLVGSLLHKMRSQAKLTAATSI